MGLIFDKNDRQLSAISLSDVPAFGDYDVIVIDPPWPVKKIIRKVRPNQKSELDYGTISIDEISNFPINDLSADNAVLFIWTTHAFLECSFDIMRKYGFKYQRLLTWEKNSGMCFQGFYHCSEFCLFGYKGRSEMYPKQKAIPTVFKGKSERHSAKPDRFYRLIEPLGKKRIDIFARTTRPGWEVWGNEVKTTNEESR